MKTGKYNPINLYTLRKDIAGITQTEISNALDIDIKTYRGYEKGKIPKSDILLSMQGYFEKLGYKVSIDYLLGVSDFRSPENDYIGSVTGLSDKAINALIEDKKRPLHIIDTINLLLDNIHLQNVVKLFCNMYMFLITSPKCFKSLDGKFSSDYIILESNFEDKNHPALHGLGMGLSSDNVGGLFLQNITSDLSVIKDKL